MKIVVGLGNPGEKYKETRHNIGFMVLDHLADQLGVTDMRMKWNSLMAEVSVNGEKMVLFKPHTYMNLSGEAVSQAVRFWRVPVENVLVIYDDLALPFGQLRLRLKGGHGGHNGVRSLLQHLGEDGFKRMRIGIDQPRDGDVTRHVLSPFSKTEQAQLPEVIGRGAEAALEYVQGHDFAQVMNRYNQRLQ